LLEGITRLLAPEAERRRVQFRWEAPAPLPAVALDRIQMEQVFVNVLKNALEAIGADGTITLRLGQRGPRPFVAIEDSGPGLRPEARANLFTPFFTTKENGNGLGLSICRSLAWQSGGKLHIRSRPGEGTEAVLVLPVERGKAGNP
ncbi:MAG: sensor histidine kinase, partial [Thermoanaerobaculia bacterium]